MRRAPAKLFHAHVTITNTTFDIPKGWKKTEIVLEGPATQTDIMLTKHYSLGEKVSSLEEILKDCDALRILFNVLRVKVECDSLPEFTAVTDENYVEIHCKVKGKCELGEGWVRSRNPIQPDTYFWNARIYSGIITDIVERMNSHAYSKCALDNVGVSTGESVATILEFKVEQVVFDSNRAHDKWWA